MIWTSYGLPMLVGEEAATPSRAPPPPSTARHILSSPTDGVAEAEDLRSRLRPTRLRTLPRHRLRLRPSAGPQIAAAADRRPVRTGRELGPEVGLPTPCAPYLADQRDRSGAWALCPPCLNGNAQGRLWSRRRATTLPGGPMRLAVSPA